MPALFTYGTLVVPALFVKVSGEARPQVPVRLVGYRRGRVRRQPFPGIVPEETATTEGVIYQAVSQAQMTRVDAFEDDYYERTTVKVETIADGQVIEAQTYVVAPRYRHLVTTEEWDVRTFIDRHLESYLDA